MRRIAILAEGNLDRLQAKTAVGVLRYSADPVVAVIDSAHVGQDAAQALGEPNGRGIPVVATVTDAVAYQPDTLLIGIAPIGGKLPEEWRIQLLQAIESGMNIVSGLHAFLGEDPQLQAMAHKYNVQIWDVRRPPEAVAMRIRRGVPHRSGSHTVYLCGSDCNVGKMTVAMELEREAQGRGLSAAMAATGQTGIMITGRGIPVDRFISDFVSGGVEAMVDEFTQQYDWVFVEGQGALGHPAYSAVTLGLLHGAAPDLLVLCHAAGRTHIHEYELPIPSLSEVRKMYETAAAWLKPAPTICVALNTFGLSEGAARRAIAAAAEETGLPTTDPVRFGTASLLDSLLASI